MTLTKLTEKEFIEEIFISLEGFNEQSNFITTQTTRLENMKREIRFYAKLGYRINYFIDEKKFTLSYKVKDKINLLKS